MNKNWGLKMSPLTNRTREEIDEEEHSMLRADPDCFCPVCGKRYRDHPYDGDINHYYPDYYLNRLCTGQLIKL